MHYIGPGSPLRTIKFCLILQSLVYWFDSKKDGRILVPRHGFLATCEAIIKLGATYQHKDIYFVALSRLFSF